MAAHQVEMQSFTARLRTFEQPQPLVKREATTQAKKKNASTVKWPHKKPEPILLARAGFFYRPDQESLDNVACFLCNVRLDGWEETDVPIQEHIAHTRGCPWAIAASVSRTPDDGDPEIRDPLSEDMCAARKATFEIGEGWPHESKKGWKCKIAKMVDAGWCWDPSGEGPEGYDGVTCFYCDLSLDGWEPKDDPFQEHKRREPGCRYFELLEHFHGADAANGKIKKSKGKGARGSTASKTSRISTMSAMSAMSDVASMPGSYIDPLEDLDDSNITTATNAAQATAAGATKGKKKGSKTTAKGTKGKKKASTEEEAVGEGDVQYPTLSQTQAQAQEDVDETIPAPSKKPKKGTRASKQIDSSVMEISQSEMAAPKKSTKATKRKGHEESEVEPEAQPAAVAPTDGEQIDMEDDVDRASDDFAPGDESTPTAERTKPKRGVKRSSDGQQKGQTSESSVVNVDAELEPPVKRKRGRPKKASNMSMDSKADGAASDELQTTQDDPIEVDTIYFAASGVQQSAAPAKKAKGRPKKASSARSSRSSKVKSTTQESDIANEPEDLARDEMEIEQELERIAAEQASQQAVQEEQDRENEFEPSPSSGRISKDKAELQNLQNEVHEDDEQVVAHDHSPPRQSYAPAGFTPSPNGSDKENRRSSVNEPSVQREKPAIVLSPTKTVKIPVAASTPNRSPGKMMLSPSKQISHLASTKPWEAVDPDRALAPSLKSEDDQAADEGEELSELLLAAAGDLMSPEKQMTVEEWVRHRAVKSEDDLKRRCEQMVSTFEKEGMRALESVQGLRVVA